MDKMRMESVDMTAQNVEKIGALFPNCITETVDEEGRPKKAINFELLRQMLSEDVLDGDEAYEFTWVGKKAAIVEANKPIRKTLRPCKEESVDWDTTENLYIEGDNLEVLKLLQESYLGKVKVIYIDPPYNTGSGLIYRNNFFQTEDDYLEDIGAYDDEHNRLFLNTRSNGRFHSDWCSMIYPRLLLSRNILSDDGIIVLTIDDSEIENVTSIMNEVFGEENHLATVIIKNNPSGRSTVKGFSINHEYALFYSKSNAAVLGRMKHTNDQKSRYKEQDEKGYFEWENFRKNGTDSDRGDRPKQYYPVFLNTTSETMRIPNVSWDDNTKSYNIHESPTEDEIILWPNTPDGIEKVWKYGIERTRGIIGELLVKKQKGNYELYRKKYLNDEGSLPRTWWDKPEYSARDNGTRTLTNIFGPVKIFDFPKAPEAVKDALIAANLQDEDFTGWSNHKIVPELNDSIILEHIQKIQRANQLAPSPKLEGKYNLTIEMETGVGKTYTYIKTMFELNKHYGWSKFIVVVPSIAIREGVYKSFEVTQEHFAEEYGKKIRFFIYNSSQLTEIDRFASDNSINVMIINSQAFNARGKDARRIYMKLDEFRSRRPIDIIAKTNPIMIIDEPQSVEGKQTKENLKQFNPMLTLRYSATHRSDSIYNMIYRLDAMEAYNKRLVKKIAVKGITESGSTATESYVYLEGINLSKAAPTATIQFDVKGASGVRKITKTVNEGFNLYPNSGEMEEYRNNFIVKRIDGRDDSVEFVNGIKIYAGDVIGKVSEEQLRRIQIRETILSHIDRERQLFHKGIKVLSLFFIDEVDHYREYDAAGRQQNGIFAQMFEEEYADIVNNLQIGIGEDDYLNYLNSIQASDTHAGYFSIDKKGRMTNSKIKDKKEKTSDDIDAYDLIMKNKELLLDRDPKRSPVRFIFSHSALREGWDNPNVFQICTLKQSSSEVRKRQEVGRGLRLCVNQDGDRMDTNVLGADVHNVNVLTVIASESYDSFAKGLQSEIAEAVADRPKKVTTELFSGKVIRDTNGNEQVIDEDTATAIYESLIENGYVKKGQLTDKYYKDKANGEIEIAEEVADSAEDVISIIDSIYDPRAMQPENARSNNVELQVDENKLAMPEFKALWSRINAKSVYVVDFDTDELIRKATAALDSKLHVSKIYFKVESGAMEQIKSKDDLLAGASFVREESAQYNTKISASNNVKYDLVGKLVDETGLTRKAIVKILQSIQKPVFDQFKDNPEEFIIKAADIINDEKATAIIQHITYNALDEHYETDVFTEPTIKGKLGTNAMKAKKHLYDHIVYDSSNEQKFAEQLDTNTDVAVYVKLPDGFYISTPVGRYNPDWAIAFYEGKVKHIYFVAETKGSMSSMQLRLVEESKIHCAREHFKAISSENVVYDVVDSYDALLNKVMR